MIAGAAVALGVIAYDWYNRRKAPKVLEIATALLFGSLARYTALGGLTGSIVSVRLRVDAGLLLIVLVSIAIRRPFTLQYARKQVAREWWDHAEFIRTNHVITAVWALAFAVLVIADLVLLYLPNLPPRVGVIATILALTGAFKFTAWYPDRRQAKTVK